MTLYCDIGSFHGPNDSTIPRSVNLADELMTLECMSQSTFNRKVLKEGAKCLETLGGYCASAVSS